MSETESIFFKVSIAHIGEMIYYLKYSDVSVDELVKSFMSQEIYFFASEHNGYLLKNPDFSVKIENFEKKYDKKAQEKGVIGILSSSIEDKIELLELQDKLKETLNYHYAKFALEAIQKGGSEYCFPNDIFKNNKLPK